MHIVFCYNIKERRSYCDQLTNISPNFQNTVILIYLSETHYVSAQVSFHQLFQVYVVILQITICVYSIHACSKHTAWWLATWIAKLIIQICMS